MSVHSVYSGPVPVCFTHSCTHRFLHGTWFCVHCAHNAPRNVGREARPGGAACVKIVSKNGERVARTVYEGR